MKLFTHSFTYCRSLMLAVSMLLLTTTHLTFATDTDIWDEVGNETQSIDHTNWQLILDAYIEKDTDSNSSPAINLFKYNDVSDEHKRVLNQYLTDMQSLDPRDYSKAEQFAYWVNLYNALTVDLILDNYPVKSITKLGSILSFGPWDQDAAEIAGEILTLNDIEHKILRPIWQDPRIHYAVNCASFSCPNLSDKAFTSENYEALLEQAAKDYVNHSRGVDLKGNKLKLSKIYKWYADDFGSSEEELLEHIAAYANPELVESLKSFDGKVSYHYDWSLNEPTNP